MICSTGRDRGAGGKQSQGRDEGMVGKKKNSLTGE